MQYISIQLSSYVGSKVDLLAEGVVGTRLGYHRAISWWVGLVHRTVMAAFTEKMTKEIYPYHTTLYENLFLLRVSISLNETAATVQRQASRKLFRWKSLSCDPDVTLAVESCAA